VETLPVPFVRSITRWTHQGCQCVDDHVAGEEPLEIRIDGQPVAVTMRTPGNDSELGLGYCFNEGLLPDPRAIRDIRARNQRVDIRTISGNGAALTQPRTVTSACGICGRAGLDAIQQASQFPHAKGGPIVQATRLLEMPDQLRSRQPDFDSTGGIHAAALVDTRDDSWVVREDIGRHNAVDKLVGWAIQHQRLPLVASVLLVSGRAGFELVQKATLAGIPFLAAIGAPSSLAVDLAAETDTTLVGFLRPNRFNVYAAPWRIAQ